MDATDYRLMVREYSIWNATIASLQFWTADLDPVTLGRAREQVYTTFFYSSSSHTLCQQSDKILFGQFVIALNAAFDQQLSLADEGYESGSDTVDLPIPLRKTPRIHHFAAWNMLHLIQNLSHHEICHKLHPDQYADDYHSVQLMTTLHILLDQLQPALQDAQKMKKRKRTSKQYLLMMITGLPRKYLKEHYTFMSMAYHIGYAHTHALMQTIRCLLT